MKTLEIPTEILEQTRDHMVYGYEQGAKALLESFADATPEEREPLLKVIEWFESQADRLSTEPV